MYNESREFQHQSIVNYIRQQKAFVHNYDCYVECAVTTQVHVKAMVINNCDHKVQHIPV